MKQPIVNIVTDGAYFKEKSVITWGAIMYDNEFKNKLHEFVGYTTNQYHMRFAQVYGELEAIRGALAWVVENVETPTEIIFHYDYEGVRSWALDYWKANNELTISYKNFMFEFAQNHPNIKLTFVKVDAHKGVNVPVHNLIQLKEIYPGVTNFKGKYIINMQTTDQRIIDFFDTLSKSDD
jgi:ribonuclease HI